VRDSRPTDPPPPSAPCLLMLRFPACADALNRMGVEGLVPVVMEESCTDQRSWVGPVGGKLGQVKYTNLIAADLKESSPWPEGIIEELAKEIRSAANKRRGAAAHRQAEHLASPADLEESLSRQSSLRRTPHQTAKQVIAHRKASVKRPIFRPRAAILPPTGRATVETKSSKSSVHLGGLKHEHRSRKLSVEGDLWA
jgi:hypothetical protein